MNQNEIKPQLTNKHFLFVDDRLDVVSYYISELKKYVADEANVTTVCSLKLAYEEITANPQKYHMIFIDLNIPAIPVELKAYASKLSHNDYNDGQALGLWLSECHPKLHYIYITAVPMVLDYVIPSQNEALLIDKLAVYPDQFVSIVCDELNKLADK